MKKNSKLIINNSMLNIEIGNQKNINSAISCAKLGTPPINREIQARKNSSTNQNNLKNFLTLANKNPSIKNIKPKLKSESSINIKNENSTVIYSSNLEKSTQIKVIARFRPLNSVEEELNQKEAGNICVKIINNSTVSITSQFNSNSEYTLDCIFNGEVSQESFYKEVISETISDTLNGYNGTVFTYGQSGSGKTYTMLGVDLTNHELKGIIPRAVDQIFDHINNENNNNLYEIKMSILQIYKEKLYDMLIPSKKYSDLKIKEDPKIGTYVQNLTSVSVEDKEEVYALIEHAEEFRSVAETKLNKSSSRSHFKLPDDTEKIGILNLVDLAGSEKVSKTGAIGETLEEAKKINSSLSSLGNVIHALSSNNKEYVNYRDSKLTRLLKDSLGGNFKTTLIVTCSPHSFNVEETLSSLNFAKRAKNVKNKVKVNIKRSPQELENIIANLTLNIHRLLEENKKLQSESSKEISFCKTETKYINSKFSLDSQKVGSNNTEHNLETVIKQKDEEINKLKEDIENLTNEKSDLLKEIKNLKRFINLDKNIELLEKSIKSNITLLEDLNNKKQSENENLYKLENIKLKEMLNFNHGASLKDLEKNLENGINLNFTTKVKNVNENISKFLETISFKEKENYLYSSYDNIYKNCKIILNDLLKVFLKTSDIFNENKLIKQYQDYDQIIVDRKKYLALKSSFLQLNALNTYYEKILNGFFGKLAIDIKNYHISEKYASECGSKILGINKILANYLEIIEEVKKMKRCDNNFFTINDEMYGEYSRNDQIFRSKFIKRVGKNQTKLNELLITNIMKNKINSSGNKWKKDCEENDKLDDLIEYHKDTSQIRTIEEENQLSTNTSNNLRLFTKPQMSMNFKDTDEEFQVKEADSSQLKGSFLLMSKDNMILLRRKSSNMFNNSRLREISLDKKESNNNNNDKSACFLLKKDDQSISFIKKNEEIGELKLLKKEMIYNRQLISNFTMEIAELQKKAINNEKLILEYQKNNQNNYKLQIENLRMILDISKDFYNEEIIYSKNVNNELSNIIDEILINEKTIKDLRNNKVLCNFYLEKKNKILIKDSNENPIFSNIANSFLNGPGTASKKLDYLQIEYSKKIEEPYKIVYGSGLSFSFPNKGPMLNNLKHRMHGDSASDLITPRE